MVRMLGREMVKQGHTVCVAGLYPPGYGQADYEEDQGVKSLAPPVPYRRPAGK